MVWLLRRINDVLYNPANLGVPKHILIEEIFSSMKNKQLLDGALASIKTVRKNLGGVTMIGQSADDLGDSETNGPSIWRDSAISSPISRRNPRTYLKPTLTANGPVYVSPSVSFNFSSVQNHSECCTSTGRPFRP